MNGSEACLAKEYFRVNVSRYAPDKNFDILRPASLNHPKDFSVMFVTSAYMQYADALRNCENCLVFWPEGVDIPEEIRARHVVRVCADPRKGYCAFFRDHHITYYPPREEYEMIGGAFIAKGAVIGRECQIMPGAYIGGEVVMGDHCYIGTGARLVGSVRLGRRVIVRENSVIGADGFSTDRDENGHALTMPQFGGVILEDDVQIGALTIIARGAIDCTVIRRGSKIDNSAFISHNVTVGEDSFIVGESILFGSSSTGRQSFISGNATIRDGRHVGSHATVGMGAVVTRDVPDGAQRKGNPAK